MRTCLIVSFSFLQVVFSAEQYKWFADDVVCSELCGESANIAIRRVGCMDEQENNVSESLCDEQQRPDETVFCNATPPCDPFWATDNLVCPTECGLPLNNGTNDTQLSCKATIAGQIVVVADSFCPERPPYLCLATPPCAIYRWVLEDSSCPERCGLLVTHIERSLSCFALSSIYPAGIISADSYCVNDTLPNRTLACPQTPPCDLSWSVVNETCESECGLLEMNATIDVVCKGIVAGEESVVDDVWCENTTLPLPSRICPPTPPCAPQWNTSGVVCPSKCGLLSSKTSEGVVCSGIIQHQVMVINDSWCTEKQPIVECFSTPPCDPFWSSSIDCPTLCGLPAINISADDSVCKATVNDQIISVSDSWCEGFLRPIVCCPATPLCEGMGETTEPLYANNNLSLLLVLTFGVLLGALTVLTCVYFKCTYKGGHTSAYSAPNTFDGADLL
jgi:hypothetical protein